MRNIQSSLIPRPQTSSTFLRICADPRRADVCIVLVRSLIPSCSKWPASLFDTEPNAPTTTGTTFDLGFQVLLISLARSWYFSYFSVSFCSTISGNSYVHNDCFLCLVFLNYNVWPSVMDFTVCLDGKVPQQFYFLILFYAFGGILIPFVTALNSIFLAQLPTTRPTTSCLFLYSVCASLGQLHKICCTVSS